MRRRAETADAAEHAQKIHMHYELGVLGGCRRRLSWCRMRSGLFAVGRRRSIRRRPRLSARRKVDCAGGKVITNAVIVVDNDRITSVGTAPPPAGRRGHRPEPASP